MESIITQVTTFFKLESWREYINKFALVIAIFLGFVFSFSMGRLTKLLETEPTFTFVSKEAEEENFEEEKTKLFGGANSAVSTSTIVASRTGKRYYFVWCKGADNLKPANKIYFKTEAEAEARGLTLANNCN